jgi:hypothetical protein
MIYVHAIFHILFIILLSHAQFLTTHNEQLLKIKLSHKCSEMTVSLY